LKEFLTDAEYNSIIAEAQKKYKLESPKAAEEKLSEEFIKYSKERVLKGKVGKPVGKLQQFFEKFYNIFKKLYDNRDQIQKLYDDILEGKATEVNSVSRAINRAGPKFRTAPELTTTVLEKIGDRKEVNREFITNLLKSE
jgi:hypothetical protein